LERQVGTQLLIRTRRQLGMDLSLVSHVLAVSTDAIIDAIVQFTGNS
jgi:hypothetical protein